MREVSWFVRVAAGVVMFLGVGVGAMAQREAGAATRGEDASAGNAAESRNLTDDDFGALSWRSIGPANMGGRCSALAFEPGNSKTFYIGFGTGGLWKTTNNGTTYTPIFDDQDTLSIGSIGVADAPEDWPGWDDEQEPVPAAERAEKGKGNIVWVGTGEGNGRNSSSWGNGVYRSTDAGSTWTHCGLEDSHDIPALAIDPRDPDVCYVAALGHLWGPNPTRGIYKTSDAGTTWDAVLQIDDNTGACDIVIDPNNPDTLFAAMYKRRRTIGTFQSGSDTGGIFRSDDAGRTWKKLTNGLPAQTGRIGLAIFPGNSNILCAMVESDDGGKFSNEWNDRSRAGGVFRSEDRGETWERTSDFAPRPFYFSRIRIDPTDDQRVYLLGWHVYVSDDGGKNFRSGFSNVVHVDHHAMIIDPADPAHLIIGNDGGFYISWDKGETWAFQNQIPLGQFYNVSVDDSDPYRVGGGLQDNGTWIGPSETILGGSGAEEEEFMGRSGAITNQDWTFVLGGDGFHMVFDPTDPNIIFAEWQGGQVVRTNLATGEHHDLKPAPKEGEQRFRFNWNAPLILSPHDPTMLYLGGNCVFRLTERGDQWERISPDLSRQVLAQVTTVGSEAETAGTVITLAESPVAAGTIWAGTDDGRLHVTTNGGDTWTDVTPDAGDGRSMACVEPSSHDAKTAYLAVDGHTSNEFGVVLLMTEDLGRTWTSISGNLPDGWPTRVVREDPRSTDVLYVGTEQGAWVSIDRGTSWVKLGDESLPNVRVDDLKIQGREMDLVAGTHGRSVWIMSDVSALSQLTPEVRAEAFHVFDTLPGKPRYYLDKGGLWSDSMFIAPNPAMGAHIQYWIRDYAPDEVKLKVKNDKGVVVRELEGPDRPGINRVVWDLQAEPKQRIGNPHGLPEFLPPGAYTVELAYGDEKGSTTVEVLAAPGN